MQILASGFSFSFMFMFNLSSFWVCLWSTSCIKERVNSITLIDDICFTLPFSICCDLKTNLLHKLGRFLWLNFIPLAHGYSQCPCLLSSLVIVSGKMEISAFVMGPVGSLPGCVYICVCACGRWALLQTYNVISMYMTLLPITCLYCSIMHAHTNHISTLSCMVIASFPGPIWSLRMRLVCIWGVIYFLRQKCFQNALVPSAKEMNASTECCRQKSRFASILKDEEAEKLSASYTPNNT